MLPVKHKIRTL